MSEKVESAFRELPPLPETAMKLIRTVNDARAGANEIVGILKTDVALTTEVLRRANSPLYGLAAKVSSASQAVMLLGTDEIRRVATSISLARHFGGAHAGIRRLWRHAFARALVAERLASAAGVGTETAYTAGLLADIGIYGLMVSFQVEEQRVMELAPTVEALLLAEEREFGVNHCQAGEWLAQHWRLPEPIVKAVAAHHDAPHGTSVAAAVYWADGATAHAGFGVRGPNPTRTDLTAYRELRQQAPFAHSALPEEPEELSKWLSQRVPN